MNLRQLRERAGHTQEVLAKITGLHQTTISGLETGAVKNPRLDTLQKLAAGYGVELSVVVAAVDATAAEAAA
ncbi:MAG: helix-turn-helix domain-containing protein [Vicinamibacterales bacterium]